MTTAERDRIIVSAFKIGVSIDSLIYITGLDRKKVEAVIRRWMKRYPEGRKANG